MWHVWGRAQVHTSFWWGRLKEGGHLGDLGVDGRTLLKLILEEQDECGLNMAQDRAVVNTVMP